MKRGLLAFVLASAFGLSQASMSLNENPASSSAHTQRWANRRPANTNALPPGFSTRSHSAAQVEHQS